MSDLLDLIAAQQAKAEAIQRAGEGANRTWVFVVRFVIHKLAEDLPEFTTDEVWAELEQWPQTTHERRALGAFMQEAAKAGRIKATNEYRNSARPACHSRAVRVWRSLIHKGK